MRKVVLIATIFVTMGATAQTPKEWRDSISVLIQQLDQSPNSIDLRLKKAEANINLGQYDYAINEYSKVLKQDDKNLAAMYFRAFCHTQLRHYDMARADYEAFLTIQPEHLEAHLEAHLGLAHVLQLLGRKTDATDELNRCVLLFPDSADAYAARAAHETQLQQYDAALYDWDEALRLKPSDASLAASKADVLIKMEKWRDARQTLDNAVKQGTPRAALKEWYDKLK